MLERVAMHQTRLRLPGLGIDGKGVALGSHGLVLLASIERLVAFFSLYSASQPLADLVRSLRIELVRSALGTRELVVSFQAEASERLDRVAEVARLALGYTFTGTSRHFVQFRDASAPFGYDASEVIASDGDYVLYHSTFTQVYERERELDLRTLLLRLRPRRDPAAGQEARQLWVVAEQGLGPALVSYFVRSRVKALVGMAEWPPESAFEEQPVRRFIFQVHDVPSRMRPLLENTPGLTVFADVAPGAAVQVGARHPVNLRACPVFDPSALVLFCADHDALVLDRAPVLGPVEAFAKLQFGRTGKVALARALDTSARVPVKLLPSTGPWSKMTAAFAAPSDYELLRRMAYLLGPATLQAATIAFSAEGAFLLNPGGIELTPVGQFLRELRPRLYVAAGYDPVPAVDPEVLYAALGAPDDHVLFLLPGPHKGVSKNEPEPVPDRLRDTRARKRGHPGPALRSFETAPRAVGVPVAAFVPLRDAILEAQAWSPLETLSLEPVLAQGLPRVVFDEPESSRP